MVVLLFLLLSCVVHPPATVPVRAAASVRGGLEPCGQARSSHIEALLRQLLQRDPERRPTAAQVLAQLRGMRMVSALSLSPEVQ